MGLSAGVARSDCKVKLLTGFGVRNELDARRYQYLDVNYMDKIRVAAVLLPAKSVLSLFLLAMCSSEFASVIELLTKTLF